MTARVRRVCCLLAAVMIAASVSGCRSVPVTGRDQLILVSKGQAQQLGAQAYQDILRSNRISTNARYNERVATIGRRIAAVSGEPNLQWEFNVIEDDTPNAFALPGGKVGVNTGLFKVAKNDDQLAAVMAHEVGHAIARHGSERMSQQMLLQGGLGVLGIATGSGELVQVVATAATLGVVLPYSRSHEAEADHIGLILMAKAGYDPRAAIDLWLNFEKAGGDRPPEFLSTHPAPGSRIDNLTALMPEALAIYDKTKGHR